MNDTQSMLLKLFIEYAVPPLFAFIGTALLWLLTKGALFIAAKTKNETLRGIIERVFHSVELAVRDVEQTLKPMVKEFSADGSISKEEANKLKAAALAKVKEYLGVKGIGEIVKVLGIAPEKVDAFLSSHVEAAVNRLKETSGNP